MLLCIVDVLVKQFRLYDSIVAFVAVVSEEDGDFRKAGSIHVKPRPGSIFTGLPTARAEHDIIEVAEVAYDVDDGFNRGIRATGGIESVPVGGVPVEVHFGPLGRIGKRPVNVYEYPVFFHYKVVLG